MKFHQKGIREKLLCLTCEGKLSKYEDYLSKALYGGAELQMVTEGSILHIKDLDYQKTKLAYLSIFWRASVAKTKFFQSADFGPHEERIRTMILNGMPGSYDEYGFACFCPTLNGAKVGDWHLEPIKMHLQGHVIYSFVIAGLAYLLHMKSDQADPILKKAFLQEKGTWMILRKDIRELEILFDALIRMLPSLAQVPDPPSS